MTAWERKKLKATILSVWESNPAFARNSLSHDRRTHPTSIPTETYVQAISTGYNVEIGLKQPFTIWYVRVEGIDRTVDAYNKQLEVREKLGPL